MSLKKKLKGRNKTLKFNKIDNKFNKLNLLNKKLMPSIKQKITQFLQLLIKIKNEKGEHFKSRNIEKSLGIILDLEFKNITDLEGIKGIGPMTIRKCKDFIKNGTTRELEDYKTNPLFQFLKIHGVGIKKAEQLVQEGITSIPELKIKQELLNDVQKKGLAYYDDINLRIPRGEIQIYEKHLQSIFDKVKNQTSSFQIVGSYRRGAFTSGDIDIIITDSQDNTIMQKFIEELVSQNIVVEILSRGNIKCLAVSKLNNCPNRRIDFMFTPQEEYPFAILYFTGSKTFNTVMRNKALKLGFSLNEHGLYKMIDGKKTHKISQHFPDEQAIFDFLKIEYRAPEKRTDVRSVVNKRNKTLKKRKTHKILKNLNMFRQNGTSILQILSEKNIANLVKVCDKHYYKENKSLLSDEQYDILKSYALDKYPNNEVINNGHLNIEISKDKIDLPYFMGSMEKIKPDTNALKLWRQSFKGPYVLSSKLDGISALYSTENGTKKLFTRGNGTQGLDISYLIPYLQLPQVENITIRGELLISKQVFQDKYSSTYKNVRNMIGGVMTTKKIDKSKWNDIDFVGYEVINPVLKPSKQMQWLSDNNVITVSNKTVKYITNEMLSEILLETRQNDPYDIDGVIVVHDKNYERTNRKCPKHAFAFKMVLSDQVMESQVVNVHWQISKNGYIIPKVEIVPVEIGGVTITNATAHNAAFIEKNKIGIGAVIQLVRSGDVIPKIISVIKPAEQPLMPNIPYVWNSPHVDIILQDIQDNETVRMKKILSFMQTLDVPSFGPGNIKKVFNAGFNTIPKVLSMTVEDFMTIPGFKQKMSNKISNGMRERLEKTSLADLMVATNIFERGFGKSRAKMILNNYPDILISNKSEEDKLRDVESLDGFARKTAETFVPYIPDFIDFIQKTNLNHKLIVQKPSVSSNHVLSQKKIVMTGFRDKLLEKAIIDVCGEIGNSVTKNTYILIVDSLDSDSGKAARAKKLNIKMMTPYAFQNQYFQ